MTIFSLAIKSLKKYFVSFFSRTLKDVYPVISSAASNVLHQSCNADNKRKRFLLLAEMTVSHKPFSYVLLFNFFILSSTANAVQFKIATLSPEGSYWMQTMRDAAQQIESQTNNRVSFKFYPGGVMGDDNAILRKIRLGQLHGAAMTNGSLNVFYPDVQLYNLVMKFNNLDEVDYIRNRMDKLIIDGLEQNGMTTLGFAEIGFAYLMSMNPIHNVRDLRSQKAWVPEGNFIAESALSAFSVTPIPLPIRDVFIGLQTGMVNVVAGSPTGAIALQWHTQVKYMIDLPLSYIYGIFAIDKKYFEKLSKEDQQVIRERMGKAIHEIDIHSRRDNIDAYQTILKQGVQRITLDPASTEELRSLVEKANVSLMKTGKVDPENVQMFDSYLQEVRTQHK